MAITNRVSLVASALLLVLAFPAWSVPIISNPFAFTENRGPNTAGFSVGHVLQLGALVDDAGGVPGNILSAEAILLPSGPSTPLPFQNIGSIFSGLYNSLAPYAGETGQWQIRVENNQNEVATTNTSVLDDVHVIPLATSLETSGSTLAPLITWDPVLFDHDNNPGTPAIEVDEYRVRLLNSATDQFFVSASIVGNSFQVPNGLIAPGLTFIRLEARDFDEGSLENRSSTFIEFLAVPEPGTLALLSVGLLAIGLAFARSGEGPRRI